MNVSNKTVFKVGIEPIKKCITHKITMHIGCLNLISHIFRSLLLTYMISLPLIQPKN